MIPLWLERVYDQLMVLRFTGEELGDTYLLINADCLLLNNERSGTGSN